MWNPRSDVSTAQIFWSATKPFTEDETAAAAIYVIFQFVISCYDLLWYY